MDCDFIALANPGVRSLQPYQPGKPVEELQRELGLTSVVKLASNENPLGASRRAREAAAMVDLSRYPDGNGFALKAKLAQVLGMPAQMLTLGNGSNDVLELVARAFAREGHEIVFSEHAFAVYPLVTRAIGARPVVTPAKQWGQDLRATAACIGESTRLVFIANPNNPTGTWIGSAELEGLLHELPRRVLVVVDQAYFEYVDHPDYPDCLAWIERYPNLIVTRTFSKAYGLAGLRVGYAVSHPGVADLLNRVRQPFNVNTAALVAAEAAIEDADHLRRSCEINRRGMRQLVASFEKSGLEYIPSAGNFVCVDVGRPAAAVYQALLREGVIVRPVANYGLPNHLRATIGLEDENARFLAALHRVLSDACAPP